jgi:prepilin-type processing-associated H-X9-DG protein
MTTQRHAVTCGVFKGAPPSFSIHHRPSDGSGSLDSNAKRGRSSQQGSGSGFSLVELLVLIATIAILSVLLFPGLSRAKEGGRKITCMNNLRQLGLSITQYADSNDGWFPPRTTRGRWPTQLQASYKNRRILKCPSDILRPDTEERDAMTFPADAAPRSYILNGWNDYFKARLGNAFSIGAIENKAICAKEIPQPAKTIVFGEKRGDPGFGRFYMDVVEGRRRCDEQLERGRHSISKGDSPGEGSNYAFADGSAQFLKYGRMNSLMELWGVGDVGKTNRPFAGLRM